MPSMFQIQVAKPGQSVPYTRIRIPYSIASSNSAQSTYQPFLTQTVLSNADEKRPFWRKKQTVEIFTDPINYVLIWLSLMLLAPFSWAGSAYMLKRRWPFQQPGRYWIYRLVRFPKDVMVVSYYAFAGAVFLWMIVMPGFIGYFAFAVAFEFAGVFFSYFIFGPIGAVCFAALAFWLLLYRDVRT